MRLSFEFAGHWNLTRNTSAFDERLLRITCGLGGLPMRKSSDTLVSLGAHEVPFY